MVQRRTKPVEAIPDEEMPVREVEHFSVSIRLLRQSAERRLDASYFNPAAAKAIETVRNSGMKVCRLGDVVDRVFLPPRVKRIYVGSEFGIPFLRGSHIVHFQPADIKYVSRKAQRHLEQFIVRKDMILITRSGTVGRVMLCPDEWDGWAGTEDLLRVVPNEGKLPAAYLYAFLASPLGYTQLTMPIFGAVVDHLTEDQVKDVLVPLPQTDEQQAVVRRIAKEAREAIEIRTKAVGMVARAVSDVEALLTEDSHDASVARERIAELEALPQLSLKGATLKAKMEEWQS